MNRRVFLKRGLLGGALVAVGGGTTLALWPSTERYRPKRPLVVLDERRFAVLAAIAARVVTVPEADPVELAHAVDDSLGRAIPEAQSDIRKVLMLFESALGGLVFDLRLRPFTALPPREQDRVLEAWRDSRLELRRGAYKALKNLCVTSFYRKNEGWKVANYPGPPPWFVAYANALDATPAGATR